MNELFMKWFAKTQPPMLTALMPARISHISFLKMLKLFLGFKKSQKSTHPEKAKKFCSKRFERKVIQTLGDFFITAGRINASKSLERSNLKLKLSSKA